MKSKRTVLLEKLSEREEKIKIYSRISGSGLNKKIMRLRLLGIRYLIFEICHRLNIRLRVRTNLFFNKQVQVSAHDLTALYMYLFGTLQDEELSVIKYLIKNLKDNDVFYDVGANYGFYANLVKVDSI